MELVVMMRMFGFEFEFAFSFTESVGALYSQLKELHKKNADMEERDKMLYSKGLPFLCRKTDPVSFRSAFWFYSYPPSKYMKQFISQMQGDTDSTSSNTAESICKVEPLTIAELNYLSSLLHLRTLTSYVPGELLALTWTKGGVMLHAPHCLRYCVCAMRQCSCCRDSPVRLHYRVETAIADGTAEGAFFCFDGVVTKLHSLRASEAGQMLVRYTSVSLRVYHLPSTNTSTKLPVPNRLKDNQTFTITRILDERDRVPVPDVVDNRGSDDDGDDMPDGNPIPVKVETRGTSGEAAFNADIDPVGVRRRRRPTHLPGWLRRRVWLEID
ncbi:hypothetical protein Bca101_036579 [Brassica carinata]